MRCSAESGLGYRKLKSKTEQSLARTIRPATFSKYLDLLVDSRIFTKHKQHPRGGKAEYKLTEKARQEYRAGVLQIPQVAPEVYAKEEERYRLYHLLFVIETIEPPFLQEVYDTEEGILKRVSKYYKVKISPIHLVTQSKQREKVDCTVTRYKPVSCIRITRRDYSIRREKSGKAKPAFYYVQAEGFSTADIMNYDRKFGFINTRDLTRAKVKRGIRLLVKTGIIVPIGTLAEETRYSFADKSLRQLVGSSLVVFNHTMELLSKAWQYERKVSVQERAWLERVYGRRQADRLISDCHDFFITKGRHAIKDKMQYEQEKKALYRLVKREADALRQYQQLRLKYAFPLEYMLEEMVIPPFLADSVGVRTKQQVTIPWRLRGTAS
jgi:hypothetical protein